MTDASVKGTLRSLLQINEVDIRIQILLDKKNEIPQALKSIQADIASLEAELLSLSNRLSALATEHERLAEIVRDKKLWIENREPQVKTLTTNKEYQAALKEISHAKKEILDSEKKDLEVMAQIETLQKTLEETQNANTPKIAALKVSLEEQQAELDNLDNAIHAEMTIRKEATLQVKATDLARYKSVLSRGVPVLALVEKSMCQECSTYLPPQIYNQVLAFRELHSCPHCKRILYTPDIR